MKTAAIPGASAGIALLTAILLLLPAAGASAAAGFPDPTFGSGGFTVLDDPADINEQLLDVVVLPDGKILAAGARGSSGGFLLARFNADGSPDLSFGSGGIRVEPDTNVPGAPRGINSMALRTDGKLVAAGLSRGAAANAFGFARYLPDGSLDPGFGNGGLRTVPVSPSGTARAVALAPDQKVVATGDSGSGNTAAVVRLTEGGDPDTSFSVLPAGTRFVDVPATTSDHGDAVSVLADGTTLIGGSASSKGGFLAELDASGNPVAGFGTAGIATQNFGTGVNPSGSIEDLDVLADGRIVVAGRAATGAAMDSELFVARFTAAGGLDPSFATGGVFHVNPTPLGDFGTSLELQPDGKIVIAGVRGEVPDDSGGVWLVRLTPDGQADPSFGAGGEATGAPGAGFNVAFGLTLQPDGRAVIGGLSNAGPGAQLLAGRFTADGAVPITTAKAVRCGNRVATIVGTAKADKFKGTKKADVIAGLGGNDKIKALAGNDVVCGGKGKDTLRAGAGKDTLLGEAGKDKLLGEAGRDKLLGGSGKDLCNGGAGKDAKAGGCEQRKRLP